MDQKRRMRQIVFFVLAGWMLGGGVTSQATGEGEEISFDQVASEEQQVKAQDVGIEGM